MLKHLKTAFLMLILAAASAALGGLAATWFKADTETFIAGDYSLQRSVTGQDVVLIGTSWCGYCKQTREFLAQRGVEFADLDLENSKQAYDWVESLNAPGVPVLLIGNRQIRGFRPEAIEEALSAWAARPAASAG
ncbi:glutaredoxin family protein [Pseudomarimonas arenosa]|uniref:Glutaredoxin family protein n=1 Tax=Pseudomarimonas arenosa TaxID=2774145 RepID=A0AAW3ZLM5_9GAMM|nr:glutaredoxin family protein [Pseudomarimonas arenosa]MBD8525962.1 glutaredoxin family protein [Pseudomarimonas arenosa]